MLWMDLFSVCLSLSYKYSNNISVNHLFPLKVSSRTMHIPWDGAGCLCPVGDLFNYSAPGEEPSDFECMNHRKQELVFQDISTVNEETSCMLDGEQLDSHSQRLTDGRFETDVGAYCFYAKKSYRKGEQVLWTSLLFSFYLVYNLLSYDSFLVLNQLISFF